MKALKLSTAFITIIFILLSPATKADNQDSFITQSTPFILIEDINRQGEAWATCSAALEIASQMQAENSPAVSKQLNQLSNGSALAVMMSSIADKLNTDITPAEWASLWDYSKVLMESLPDIQQTAILAKLEIAKASKDKKEIEVWFDRLGKTIEICASNGEGQQMYVDMWRELAKTMPRSE
jgi:hypothetical protein